MKDKIKVLSRMSYLHERLVNRISKRVTFRVSTENSFWAERVVDLDMNQLSVNGIEIGNEVYVINNLERGWSTELAQSFQDEQKYIVTAFLSVKRRVGKVVVKKTYCVLAIKTGKITSQPFLMHRYKSKSIALVFVDSLERVEDSSIDIF